MAPGIKPRDGGTRDDGGDAGENVGPDGERIEDLSAEELSAICAPYQASRDALLSTDGGLEPFYCVLAQFMSVDGGPAPTPPASVEACESVQAECLGDANDIPAPLTGQFALDCDGANGVVARVAVYTGDATLGDLRSCLEHQATERERVLALGCDALIVSLSSAVFASNPTCAELGLSN